LLLAFFVVMYSLSQINISKYRVLAEALNQAFNGTGKVIEPVSPASPARQVPLPDKARAANATPIALIPVPVPPQRLPLPGHEGAASEPSPGSSTQMAKPIPGVGNKPGSAGTGSGAGSGANGSAQASAGNGAEMASLSAISKEVAKALQPWVDSGQVIIRQTKLWLEIEIRTDVLFPSAVAQLADPARKVLDGVASVLARFPNPIRIEGYTDNRPIDTFKFPSNWELSAARAGSVARLFSGHGVDPERIGIFGWGQYHPVASNATPEGRNKNRRIAIVVLSDRGMPRRYFSNSNPDQSIAVATSGTPATAASAASAPATDRQARTAVSIPVAPQLQPATPADGHPASAANAEAAANTTPPNPHPTARNPG
jgi:chemotaxis protein MotB